jgi:hypothetical protein
MRPVSRALLTLTAAGCAALGPAAAVLAAGSGSVTTGPTAEAWYRSSPVCALPTGCPPGASPYAPETLHIGVDLGAEQDRTLLQLDLTGLPAGTKPAGGQLRLPIADGAQDGSRAPEVARIRTCPVHDEVEDVDGAYDAAPEPDCASASVDAVYVAATDQVPAAFTVDLGALAAVWQESVSPGALALLPADGLEPTESWHVALSRRDREGQDVATISAAISFASLAVDTAQEPPPPVQAPVDPGFAAPTALSFDSPPLTAPGPTLDAPVTAPQEPAAAPAPQAAPAQVVPVAAFVDGGFRYPAVFLLPLVFAAALGWLGRALTRDLTATS